MKSNAPIFYILSQIGVFYIVYTLLLASHRTSFAVDFCAIDYANKTAMNLAKVAIFVALIHAPGVIVAHRFAEISWKVAALPLICAFGFIAAHYANDFLIGQNGHFPAKLALTNPKCAQFSARIGTTICFNSEPALQPIAGA